MGQGGAGCAGVGYTSRAGVVLHDSSAPCWRSPAIGSTSGYWTVVLVSCWHDGGGWGGWTGCSTESVWAARLVRGGLFKYGTNDANIHYEIFTKVHPMKKLLASISLCLSASIASAAGPLDGIYACTVRLLGYSYSSYVTVNGHSDGSSVFAVAAVSPSQYFYGYGIGVATDSTFTGMTMFGIPFTLSYAPASGTLSGNIGVLVGSSVVTATASCPKIW